jgi:tryptophan synthase alpha subunit
MFEVGVDGVISGSRVIQLARSDTAGDRRGLQEFYEEMVKAEAPQAENVVQLRRA